MLAEYSGATTEFPAYNMTQMIRHSTPTTPSQPLQCPEVPETTAQQDDIIRGIAATEEEELAQQEGVDVLPPIACHGGTRGSMFGLQRLQNSMVNARDNQFILVRTLDL